MTTELDVLGLSKRFAGVQALRELSCAVRGGEVLGIMGPNGAGKTTFFDVAAGFIAADSGDVRLDGKSLTGLAPHRIVRRGLVRTFQQARICQRLSVLDNVLVAYADQPGESVLGLLLRPRVCRRAEGAARRAAGVLLDRVGLDGLGDVPAGALSYGQQRLLSVACVLATGARVVLFDEPFAGLSPVLAPLIAAAIKGIAGAGGAVLVIEHNLDQMAQVCDRVIVLDGGECIAQGEFEEVRNDPRVIEAYLS